MSERTFIVVGASLAGAKAAEELRARGFDGRVMLIGSEPDRLHREQAGRRCVRRSARIAPAER
jgi:monoamine oxidase